MSDILSDIFYLCTDKNLNGIECQVTMSQDCLTITETANGNKSRKIIIDDVIGCLCMKNQEKNGNRSNQNSDAVSIFLCIYFYSLSKSFKKSPYRKRETALLRCCKYSTFVENCDHVAKYGLNLTHSLKIFVNNSSIIF